MAACLPPPTGEYGSSLCVNAQPSRCVQQRAERPRSPPPFYPGFKPLKHTGKIQSWPRWEENRWECYFKSLKGIVIGLFVDKTRFEKVAANCASVAQLSQPVSYASTVSHYSNTSLLALRYIFSPLREDIFDKRPRSRTYYRRLDVFLHLLQFQCYLVNSPGFKSSHDRRPSSWSSC